MTLPTGITKTTYPDGRIVYLLGNVFGTYTPAPDLPAYDIGRFHVPSHGAYQQWTDRTNCPLTVKRTPTQIIAANRAFPYGDIDVPFHVVPAVTFAGPMGNAGITKYMPTGGGGTRFISDYSARFLRTGDATYLFVEPRAADSIPINYVDVATGKLPDLVATPKIGSGGTIYYQGSSPFFPPGPPIGNDAGDYGFSGGWTPSTDHFQELTYYAFQACPDAGLLWNKQAAANFAFTSQVYETLHSGMGFAVIGCGQTRQWAWGMRDLFHAHVMTLDWENAGGDMTGLHPSSYWKKLIDNQLLYRASIMNEPVAQTFRMIDKDRVHWAPWQQDYLLTTLAFAVLTGHADWVPLYLWCLGNAIARTNGTSGWPPALCTAYKVDSVVGGIDPTLPLLTWAQAFDNLLNPATEGAITQAQYDAIKANPLKLSPVQSGDYLQGTYSVLAMADYLDKKGMANVRSTYPEFDTCLSRVTGYVKTQGQPISERYSVVSKIDGAPETLPPPVITPPPTPEPPMPDTPTDPLAPLKAAADSLVTIVPQVQAAVDNLEAQIAALTAAAASGSPIPAADIAAIVAKLNGVKTGLAAAVTDSATPG